MAFKRIWSVYKYHEYLAQDRASGVAVGSGVCAGMCVQWLLDIFLGKVHEFLPPQYDKGVRNQLAFDREFENSCGTYESSIERKLLLEFSRGRYEGSAVFPIESKRCDDAFSVDKAFFGLPFLPGNLALYVHVAFYGEGEATARSRHAIAIFKNKNNGKVFLYDPNYGVYEWMSGGRGEKLSHAFYEYVKSTCSRHDFGVYYVFSLKTNQTLPVNEIRAVI